MKRFFVLISLTIPMLAQAENIKCDALLLDLSTDEPIPGYITGMSMTKDTITLGTDSPKEYVYQIDLKASIPAERSYVAKIGNLPIEQTPTNLQIAVVFMQPNERENGIDGILTDTRLDTYVLKNCKE